jgi:hypothetical protein
VAQGEGPEFKPQYHKKKKNLKAKGLGVAQVVVSLPGKCKPREFSPQYWKKENEKFCRCH